MAHVVEENFHRCDVGGVITRGPGEYMGADTAGGIIYNPSSRVSTHWENKC